MSNADHVREAGFPRVAELLEAGLVHQAWNELRRFEPATFGEALAKQRARRHARARARGERVVTQRDMLIDALREKGLMGCDEDMGIEEGEEHAESHDWSAELCAARADGLIDDLGCSFIRLSRAWWVAEIQRTMTNVWEEQARTIVDMLAGDGALEAEPRAKHEPAPRPPAVVLRATVPYAAVKPAATGPQPDSPGDLAGIAWAMANLGASSEAQQRVLQGFPQFAVTLHVRADGLVTVAGARFLGECGAVPSSEPKTRCELDELHDGRHVASIEHGVVSWPRRWDFAADREGEPEAQR